ncbi:hypothetical protein FB562_1259 [Homoserinimonas aerilata]|uniref:FAR-17a/AIG1-like protein n=1 Tax=Homoserinimonas aerilata TaxID=1162970 RepID=A0A542YJ97_9MICO|nr:hypothetical protein FB562_1259 [Homoserinimonas aerilata]
MRRINAARHTRGARTIFGVTRITAACVAVVALIGDINYTIGTGPFAIANFFSYFTVQSMTIAVIVFALGAANALREPQDPLWLDKLRAVSTCYVIVSGLVFAVILVEGTFRGIPVWAPWSSQLLHFVLPAYALLDWIVAPGREVPWKTIGWVLLFPAIWVVFTMIRGSQVYWYPYFFLDPALVEIPFEFGLYILATIVIFTGVVSGLIAISRRHHSRQTATEARPQAPQAPRDQGTAPDSSTPPAADRHQRTRPSASLPRLHRSPQAWAHP